MRLKVNLYKFPFYFLIFGLIAGVLPRTGVEDKFIFFSFLDLAAFFCSITVITRCKDAVKIIRETPVYLYYLLFIMICFLSLVLNYRNLDFPELAVSSLYAFRLLLLFLSGIYISLMLNLKIIKLQTIIQGLSLAAILIILIGWIQYFFYPDLRNLLYAGWDPHLGRIFSLYFDPNFLGVILILFFLYLNMFCKSSLYLKGFNLFTFITIIFTYSRSSYLSFVTAVLAITLAGKINQKALFLLFPVLFLSLFMLPRTFGEGVRLERLSTVYARIENTREGLNLFSKRPIFGHGFNTLRYVRIGENNGTSKDITNNSGAGFDNSFIFIITTVGIGGLIAFLLFIRAVFAGGFPASKTAFSVLALHSLFNNSLFFPGALILFWIIFASDNSAAGKIGKISNDRK